MSSFSKTIAAAICLSLFTVPLSTSLAGGKGGGSGSHSSGSHSSGSSSHSSPSHGGGSSKPPSGSNSGSHSTNPTNGSHSTPSSPTGSGYSKPSSSPTAPATSPRTQPNSPTTTHSQPPASSQSYSKPSAPDTHSPSKSSQPSATALGAASTKSMSADSYKAYQAERNLASKPPQPVHAADVKNNPAKATYKNADQYMAKRTTIVNNYNTAHPGWGSMGSGMYPNYGMWSNSFLTGMVMGYVGTSLLSNSMWMYSHRNEPWYPSYRADLEAQAASNAELKSKLAAMDAEIDALKAKNATPLQINTLPENVDPALAIAPEIMIADENSSNGMSWWYAPLFFSVGLGAAFFVVKLLK